MIMKKKYMCPSTTKTYVLTEKLMLTTSPGVGSEYSGDGHDVDAKRNDFAFDDWDDDTNNYSLPKQKSVWED